MKKLRKLSALIVAGVLAVTSLSGCGSASSNGSTSSGQANKSTIEDIKERGTIKIGVFSDKAPFGYVDSNGENQGFDVYIAKRFAKDLLGDESKAEFVLVDAASSVAER